MAEDTLEVHPVAFELPGFREDKVTFDPVVAVEAWAGEANALATRVRELEARIGSMR